MINREMRTAYLLTYESPKDEYGQMHTGDPGKVPVEVVFKIQSQAEVNNPNYVDIQAIVLTKDSRPSEGDELEIDNKIFYIKYIIPGKYRQLLLCYK